MGQLFYFWSKLRHRLRHTRAHAARILICGCAVLKWRPKFPKCFILFAHNSNTFQYVSCNFATVFSSWAASVCSKTMSNLVRSRFISLSNFACVRLPSIKCSAGPPSLRLLPNSVRCLNCARRFDYCALGSNRNLGGAGEHLIDGSEKRICYWKAQ